MRRTDLSIIDIHAHIWLGSEEENIQCLRRAAGEYGIEKILISVLDSHHPDPEEITRLNNIAAKICDDDPLFGTYVTVSPEHANALQVLEEGIQRGAVGMKIWVSCLCDEACCNVLYRRCAEADLPVLVHTFAKATGQLPGESTAVHLRRAALAHPETAFIMAHLGGNCYHGLPMIRDLKNVFVDFSGSTCRRDDLPYALEQLGAERILFGTDMPGSFVMSYGQVLSAELGPQQMQMICRENAQKLFPALRKRNEL